MHWQASGILFGPEAGNYENIIFRILGLGFLTAGTMNWTQEVRIYLKSLFLGRHEARGCICHPNELDSCRSTAAGLCSLRALSILMGPHKLERKGC